MQLICSFYALQTSLEIFSGLVKKNFPPRIWPDAYSEARTSANRSGMDSLRYRKRKSDTFWCDQQKKKAAKKLKKNQGASDEVLPNTEDTNRESQDEGNSDDHECSATAMNE